MSTQPKLGNFGDHSSINAFHERNEHMVREYQVAVENMTLVRERLAHCARTEGVNQFERCKELREQYWALCNDRFRGMVFPEGAEPSNRLVPGLINPANNKKD